MTLLEKAKKEAKKDGKRVNAEIAKGLKAIQKMHNLCKQCKGSPYRIFQATHK